MVLHGLGTSRPAARRSTAFRARRRHPLESVAAAFGARKALLAEQRRAALGRDRRGLHALGLSERGIPELGPEARDLAALGLDARDQIKVAFTLWP